MNIRMDENPFARNIQGFSKHYHEVLILLRFLQTKPLVKKKNITFFVIYYTVNKNRNEKEIVDNQYENDCINFNDIIPNPFFGRKNHNEMSR